MKGGKKGKEDKISGVFKISGVLYCIASLAPLYH
jgi:hypothetical protein